MPDQGKPGGPTASGSQHIAGDMPGPHARDVTVPAIPADFRFRPMATLSVAELRARATHYRRMAATASTQIALRGLLKLAERFDAKADDRERQDRSGTG